MQQYTLLLRLPHTIQVIFLSRTQIIPTKYLLFVVLKTIKQTAFCRLTLAYERQFQLVKSAADPTEYLKPQTPLPTAHHHSGSHWQLRREIGHDRSLDAHRYLYGLTIPTTDRIWPTSRMCLSTPATSTIRIQKTKGISWQSLPLIALAGVGAGITAAAIMLKKWKSENK